MCTNSSYNYFVFPKCTKKLKLIKCIFGASDFMNPGNLQNSVSYMQYIKEKVAMKFQSLPETMS